MKELVQRKDWQNLRMTFVGTWNKIPVSNCSDLRKWLGDFSDLDKLLIVRNYLTGTGFRTGRIKHDEISKLRTEVCSKIKEIGKVDIY